MTVQVPAVVGGVGASGMVPPVRVIDVEVKLTVPPHWEAVGVPKTVKFAGNESVKLTPVKAAAVVLDRVMVAFDMLPVAMVVGENALATVKPAVTVKEVRTVTGLVIFWSLCRLPAEIVLVRVLVAAVAGVVTVKTSVQVFIAGGLALRGIVPPLKVIEDESSALVTVPPHWDAVGVPETVMPAGRLSVRLTLV